MRRVAIIASASGNGKTTLGRALAGRLGVPFHELDALVHGPGWTDLSAAELRATLGPLLAGDAWVIDGSYHGKIGTLVLDVADTVVWLDLPLRIWLPRLFRRTMRRVLLREVLWNGNRQTLRDAFWGRSSLFRVSLRSHFHRRQVFPVRLAGYPVVRLTVPGDVARFLESARLTPGVSTASGR